MKEGYEGKFIFSTICNSKLFELSKSLQSCTSFWSFKKKLKMICHLQEAYLNGIMLNVHNFTMNPLSTVSTVYTRYLRFKWFTSLFILSHPSDWELLWGWDWYFYFLCPSNNTTPYHSIQSCIWLPYRCEAMWVLLIIFGYGIQIYYCGIFLYVHARNLSEYLAEWVVKTITSQT